MYFVDFYYINEYFSLANQQFTTAEQFYDKATEIGISPEVSMALKQHIVFSHKILFLNFFSIIKKLT